MQWAEVQIKLFSLDFSFLFHALIKKKSTNLHTTCISLFLSTICYHLPTLWDFFLMNICPTPHNPVPSAPISLLLVVLHPAICTFLCATSYLLFSTIYLSYCISTLFPPPPSLPSSSSLVKQVYSFFCHLKVLLLCLPCLPVLDESVLCWLCCFFSHMQDIILRKTEKIWSSHSILSPKQLAAIAAQDMAREELLYLCDKPAHRRPTASFQLSKCEVPVITDHLGCLSSQNQVTRSQILYSQRH